MNIKEEYIEALNALNHDKCILLLDEYLELSVEEINKAIKELNV